MERKQGKQNSEVCRVLPAVTKDDVRIVLKSKFDSG